LAAVPFTFIYQTIKKVSTNQKGEGSSSQSNAKAIPYRPKGDVARLTVHPVSEQDGLVISVTPPMAPEISVDHMPCDIVLVIDVSGSMNMAAPVPGEGDGAETEHNGLSVLDLTKHAARTILYTLNENDRLAIVTFSTDATVSEKVFFSKKPFCGDFYPRNGRRVKPAPPRSCKICCQ
jgi:hypothetical protein